METEDSHESQEEEKATTTETELEKWKSIHSLLKRSVFKAQEGIAILKAQKRYWLEQLAFNLNDAGKVEASSTWAKAPDKNNPKTSKTTASAKKRKQQTTASVASASKAKKKPRVKDEMTPRSVESKGRQLSESSMATSEQPEHPLPLPIPRGVEQQEYASTRFPGQSHGQFGSSFRPQSEPRSSEYHHTYPPPPGYHHQQPWNATSLSASREQSYGDEATAWSPYTYSQESFRAEKEEEEEDSDQDRF